MKRSRYRNKFLKDKSQTSRENYKIQRNLCKKLLRKTKKSYFESLNTKKSRIIEPSGKLLFLFPQKRRQKVKRLSLMKQKKHFTYDKKIYTIFNSFFSDLKISDYCNYFPQNNIHSLSTIIKNLEKHPSILNIRKRILDSVFSFRKTTKEEVSKVIWDLNTKKSFHTCATPTKIIKLNSDIFSNLIYKHFSYCIDKGERPNDLKHADIVPIYKKINKWGKENYRAVTILSNLSKIYEKLICNQLYEYLNNMLFPSQCCFRKRCSVQHCLLVMIEKFKEAIDRGNGFGAFLTDFSKAFDCINHPPLIAKLYNYWVSPLSINVIFSYLSYQTHRTKINECFSERSRIECSVPQCWILYPLLFNIEQHLILQHC